MKKILHSSVWFVGFLLGLVQFAHCSEIDNVDVTVNVEEVLEIEYTGGEVEFTITPDDIDEGSQGQMTDFDVNWWANVQPWDIYVERSDWEQIEGDGDWDPPTDYIPLRIKSGPPHNTRWQEISTDPEIWFSGTTTGTGTYQNIDWQIVRIGWNDDPGPPPPGIYECTVTFSIESQ